MLRDLREGWSEFRSHTWLWVIVAQFGVILMAWYGSFEVLGPVVALAHLGGAAGWGAITASESIGLIVGGLVSLKFTPRRPMLFVVVIGGAIALSPVSLAGPWPLPLVCLVGCQNSCRASELGSYPRRPCSLGLPGCRCA